MDINLRGAFFASRWAAEEMMSAGSRGVIVNIASTAGFHARGAGLAHYVASKHALIGLTKALAVELGPAGIRVLAVAPVVTQTPGLQENLDAYQASGMGDRLTAIAQSLPIRRAVRPDDIARVVLFCASDLSGVMTGSTLLADGGDVAR
jgi:NAD(P)-dependent dehydrogenase (short-subunit alcohol dehydrogenase family)